MRERFFKLRYEFVKSNKDLSHKHNLAAEFIVKQILGTQWLKFDNDLFAGIFGVDETEELSFEIVKEVFLKKTDYILFSIAYCLTGDDDCEGYHNWMGNHTENEMLDELYNMLESFGYEMSDEEKAYRDGTHELFETEETE